MPISIFYTSWIGLLLAGLAFLLLPRAQEAQHCYAGITSLSTAPDAPETPNCFTVSRAGTFANVFRSARPARPSSGWVIPGLWDGHGHILPYGEFLSGVDLFGAVSVGDVRKRVADYVAANPHSGTSRDWIRGVGWDQAAFGGVMPTAADLEGTSALDGKFIMLDRVDVHCVWVSNAILQLLPDPLPPSPIGGEIITEPGPGVFCDNAMDMVLQHWPSPKPEQKREFVKRAMAELNKVGLVGAHDAGVRPRDLELYTDMVGTSDWTLRVYAMRECEKRNTFCPDQTSKISMSDGMLNVQSVKLFADGALGSWGSALLEPYTDHTWTSGSLLVNATTLTDLATSWALAGFQVNIHAIGDHANRLAIDAQSEALRLVCPDITMAECQNQRRFRIEHAQIVHVDDQKRMHEIGIIPSIQPTHATSDMEYAEKRLGHSRTIQEAYRMRSMLPLQPILGSDFPVEPPNPFQGLYAAIARRSPRTGLGASGRNNSWYPSESLTLAEALRGFTIGPAHGAFLDGEAGVIQTGAFADWVVLDQPLDQVDVESLRVLQIRETWVAGRMVYRRDG